MSDVLAMYLETVPYLGTGTISSTSAAPARTQGVPYRQTTPTPPPSPTLVVCQVGVLGAVRPPRFRHVRNTPQNQLQSVRQVELLLGCQEVQDKVYPTLGHVEERHQHEQCVEEG